MEIYLRKFTKLGDQLDSGDRKQQRFAAHSLKSSSHHTGAIALSEMMARFEERLDQPAGAALDAAEVAAVERESSRSSPRRCAPSSTSKPTDQPAVQPAMMPACRQRRTKLATSRTPSLSMMLAWCFATVRTLMLSFTATSFEVSPYDTSRATSISRSESPRNTASASGETTPPTPDFGGTCVAKYIPPFITDSIACST